MAENRTGTSAATRNTEYFAVVDKLYKPNSGEKVFDIKGKRILVKNPEALENFKDMAAFWHRFAAEVFNPVDNLLDRDPNSSIIKYKFNAIDLITDIAQNAHDKMRHRPANKDIDFSILTFEDMYERVCGTSARDDLIDAFNEYEEDLKAFGPGSEKIKKSIMGIRFHMANTFQRIVAVYTFCLNKYGYNIFTPYKIHNCDFDNSTAASVYKLFLTIWYTNPLEDGIDDKIIDLICLDPYFMGTWVFRHMLDCTYDNNGEIHNAVSIIDPAFAAKWNDYLIKLIDKSVNIPNYRDRDRLMSELLTLKKTLEFEHMSWCLPENVVSPKLQEVRKKIEELEWEKRQEAYNKRLAEEKKAARENRTNEVKPDKASVAWVLLVLFLIGPFGIIPAIVFFKSKRPKRALCCLIPALVWFLPSLIMGTASLFV